MTNLRKCVGISSFAILALAFVCLIIGQAAIAKIDKAVDNPNADNSFETAVPLPTLHRGPSGSVSSIGDATESTSTVYEGTDIGLSPRKYRDGGMTADGSTKAQGDNVSDPFIIGDQTALPFTGTGDVSTGTNEGEPGFCLYGLDLCVAGYSCAPDQWWAFTPTVDMRINATLANGTYDADDDWAIMLTDGDAVTYITCSDPAAGTMPSFVNVPLTAGHTYYIMVEALWSIGASAGAYQLDVEEYVPHPDFVTPMCADPSAQHEVELCGERLNGGCYGNFPDLTQSVGTREVVTGDPLAAILCGTLDLNPYIDPASPGIRSGIERDADQWAFTLTATTNLTLEIGAEIGCRFFMHGAPSGDCADQSYFGNVTLNQGDVVTTSFILNPGDYVFSIRANTQIMGCGEGDYGDPRYYIKTGFVPLVAFDDCPLATEIAGDTPVGTPIVEDLCPLGGDGVSGYWWPDMSGDYYGDFGMPQNGWWLWTCEESGEYTFSVCNSPDIVPGTDPQDLYMAAWGASGGCYQGSATQLAFNDDAAACGNYNSEITFIAAEGLQYYISVGSWYGDPVYCSDVWLDISHVPIPLLGDDCATEAIPITSDQFNTFANNLNATEDGPEPSVCNAGSFGGDIWFEMTAWETGTAFVEFCNFNYDVNMEVYAGATCPTDDSFIPIRCNDDGCYQDIGSWPEFHGSYTSFPVTAGEVYLIRVGGWYLPPDYPLTVGGMGFGWYNLFITTDPASIVPANDNCSDVTPTTLSDGVFVTTSGTLDYATRNDCEDFPPNRPHNVWEAFSVPSGVCMDVSCDFFTTVDPIDNSSRYGAAAGDGQAWNGCPCTGEFVEIIATLSCLNGNSCAVSTSTYPDADFNNYHLFEMMPAGDYWFVVNQAAVGLHSYWGPYTLNILGQNITCAYCTATANVGACGPPVVSGQSWIDAVRLEEINNTGTGCNGYEDRTSETATMYKGLPYTLEFDMDKAGIPDYALDVGGVWVDWDQNSVFFDLGEAYTPTRLAYTWTTELTAPLTAPLPGEGASGETRLRIRVGTVADIMSYCGNTTFGEIEDYVILLQDLECGDFDINGLDAGDIAFLQAWYFGTGPAPDYWQRGDIDGDGMITLADIVALVDALYHGGSLNCM